MESMKKTLKKYFIPHPENDHKPHFLREKSVLVTAFMIVILFGLSLIGRYAVKYNRNLASIQAAFLVDLTNEDRKSSGLPQLKLNDKLVSAANLKAQDMSAKGYFSHISPEGKTPWHWIEAAGYNYLYAGENLAVNFSNSDDVQEAWMDSPTHKANILSKNFTEIGIATSNGKYKGDNTTFVVQMFGSPKKSVSAPISLASTVNESKVIENTNITDLENEEDSNVLGAETEEVEYINNDFNSTENQTFTSFVNPEASFEDLQDYDYSVSASSFETEEVYTSWFERIVVSPGNVLDSLYKALAAIIIFALILKIFIEIRMQHPKNIAYGVMLLILVLAFMHINTIMQSSLILVTA